MINRLLVLTCLCLLVGSNVSLAGVRTEREMLRIAQEAWPKTVSPQRAPARGTIEKLKDAPAFCVYGSPVGGFVVVSRNDSRKPVLGYSTSSYAEHAMPCGMQWWLDAIAQVESQSYYGYQAASTYQAHDAVIQTKWGQGDPYDFKTPLFDGKHAPTGCVATAMAQIMKFYAYPAQGKGSGYYTIGDSDARITESVSCSYYWDKMRNSYNGLDITDEDRETIGNLMKDAGLAANMNYTVQAGGATSHAAARGFAYNFSYDSLSIQYYERSYFSDEEWMKMVYGELSNGRPILYAGQDTNYGGHAFVIDGLDAEGRVHVNWGWDGAGDGYFDISELNPTVGNTSYKFSLEQDMIFGFRCDSKPASDEQYQSLWCTQEPYTITVSSKLLTLNATNVYNFHFLTFYGTLGVALESVDGNHQNDKFYEMTVGTIESGPLWGLTNITGSKILSGLVQGQYYVYLASKSLQNATPQPVRNLGGVKCYVMTVSENGSISLTESQQPYVVTSIPRLTSSEISSTRYYDLQGREVGADGKGVLIRRQGNSVVKILKK